jgi:hypothetical protein
MRTPLLVVSVVLLATACGTPARHGGSLHQAAAPMPAPVPRPPVHTPGYYPGTPAAPVHTPAGAGLPGERVPGQAQPVPRSPNKRTLPPSKEPGLWAADGSAPRSSAITERHQIYGVDIPYPPDTDSLEEVAITDICTKEWSHATKEANQDTFIKSFPLDVRRCLAAQAYAYCVGAFFDAILYAKQTGSSYDAAVFARVKATEEHAKRLSRENCKGVNPHPDEYVAHEKVWGKWHDLRRTTKEAGK